MAEQAFLTVKLTVRWPTLMVALCMLRMDWLAFKICVRTEVVDPTI